MVNYQGKLILTMREDVINKLIHNENKELT